MTILELYEGVLASAGATIDEHGLISMTAPDRDPIPVMVGEKRLALPTRELLNAGGFNADKSLIAFHPISENVILDTSPVLEKLETALTFRLTVVIRELILQLATIAADHASHKKLKMRAHGLLSVMSNADDRTRSDIFKIINKTTTTGPKRLISLYVRKGGEYGGEKVTRLGKFYPTIVDSIDEEKRQVMDVTMRKADLPDFQGLIDYLLPDYQDQDRYSAPSNSPVAPSFHALIKSFHRVATQLNRVIDIHSDHLDNPEALVIPLSWTEVMNDLSSFRSQIPVLPGNDGAEGVKKAVVTAPAQTVAAAVAPTMAAHPALQQLARPAAPAPAMAPQAPQMGHRPQAGGGRSVDDMLRGVAAGQQRQQQIARGWGGQANDPNAGLPPWGQPEPAPNQYDQYGNAGYVRGGGGFSSGSGAL